MEHPGRACSGVTARRVNRPAIWPSQTDIADALGITRARVGQVLAGGSKPLEQGPVSRPSATNCASRFSGSAASSRLPKSST